MGLVQAGGRPGAVWDDQGKDAFSAGTRVAG